MAKTRRRHPQCYQWLLTVRIMGKASPLNSQFPEIFMVSMVSNKRGALASLLNGLVNSLSPVLLLALPYVRQPEHMALGLNISSTCDWRCDLRQVMLPSEPQFPHV